MTSLSLQGGILKHVNVKTILFFKYFFNMLCFCPRTFGKLFYFEKKSTMCLCLYRVTHKLKCLVTLEFGKYNNILVQPLSALIINTSNNNNNNKKER